MFYVESVRRSIASGYDSLQAGITPVARQVSRLPGLFVETVGSAAQKASEVVQSARQFAVTAPGRARAGAAQAGNAVNNARLEAYKFADHSSKYVFMGSTILSIYFAPTAFIIGLGGGMLLKHNLEQMDSAPARLVSRISESIIFNAPVSFVGAISSMQSVGMTFNRVIGCCNCNASAQTVGGFNAFALSMLSGVAVADMGYSVYHNYQRQPAVVPAN